MKSKSIALPVCLMVAGLFLCAQTPQPAASAQTAARTDVYHILFAKAALGKAAALADAVRKQGPDASMPGHYVVLRHQGGDAWDFVLIEHMGKQASVVAAGNPAAPGVRDLMEWHEDTYVNGPPWEQFASQMGIGSGASKTSDSVYVVSVYRAAPGHRDQLESLLSAPSEDAPAGTVLLQHLDGGAWTYLGIDRHNSWQDYAASETKSRPTLLKGQGDWFKIRDHASYHTDTIADRITP